MRGLYKSVSQAKTSIKELNPMNKNAYLNCLSSKIKVKQNAWMANNIIWSIVREANYDSIKSP